MSNKNHAKPEMIVMPEDRFRQLLQDSVDKAIQAGYLTAKQEQKRQAREEFSGFRSTEERLKALPIIRKKLEDDTAHLVDLETYGSQRVSCDILRFQKGGVRLSEEDIKATLIQTLKATIAADQHEIECMEKALTEVEGDIYYPTIPRRYFDQAKDQDVGKELNCDATTVWRQRNRLVRIMAYRLYGSEALPAVRG